METRQISASECSSSIDFVTMLNALARPEAFQDAASGDQLQQASLVHDEPITVGRGLYSPKRTASTYQAILMQASDALSHGRSVLLDASFTRRAYRQEVARQASAQGANVIFIECVCPQAVALQRLAWRWQARLEGSQGTTDEASLASDGRPDLYNAQAALWEAFVPDVESPTQRAVVATTPPLAVCVEQVLDVLPMPRFACWIEPTVAQRVCKGEEQWPSPPVLPGSIRNA